MHVSYTGIFDQYSVTAKGLVWSSSPLPANSRFLERAKSGGNALVLVFCSISGL